LHRWFIGIRSLMLVFPITIFLSACAAFACLFDRGGLNVYRYIVRPWARIILLITGIKVNTAGSDNLSLEESPCVVIMNHQSQLDIPVLVHAVPLQLRFVGKKELLKIPVFGKAVLRMGHVLIDRKDREDSLAGFDILAAEAHRLGVSIVVAPEGTRSADGRLLPFKKGAFVMAIDLGLPVLPVTIKGTRKAMPKGNVTSIGGNVEVIIGNPIPTSNMSYDDRLTLMTDVRGIIERNL
ncbi:1-acyl-sn-glycerol-3-phosphate acyltransferase, partial [bacterium]